MKTAKTQQAARIRIYADPDGPCARGFCRRDDLRWQTAGAAVPGITGNLQGLRQ